MLMGDTKFREKFTPAEPARPDSRVNWRTRLRLELSFQGCCLKRRKVRFIRGPTGRDVFGTACA
jgi:hypothetical protein